MKQDEVLLKNLKREFIEQRNFGNTAIKNKIVFESQNYLAENLQNPLFYLFLKQYIELNQNELPRLSLDILELAKLILNILSENLENSAEIKTDLQILYGKYLICETIRNVIRLDYECLVNIKSAIKNSSSLCLKDVRRILELSEKYLKEATHIFLKSYLKV